MMDWARSDGLALILIGVGSILLAERSGGPGSGVTMGSAACDWTRGSCQSTDQAGSDPPGAVAHRCLSRSARCKADVLDSVGSQPLPMGTMSTRWTYPD
jgi:hypothetical protein